MCRVGQSFVYIAVIDRDISCRMKSSNENETLAVSHSRYSEY